MQLLENSSSTKVPWNKGKLVGQKPPLKLREIWAIRITLQLARRTRDLALFNLAIDLSFGPAIWYVCASEMWRTEVRLSQGPV